MMEQERGISMNEFKMVVESFRSDMKKIVEVVNHRFDKLEGDNDKMKTDMNVIKADMNIMKSDIHMLKEQTGLLMEGQAEIKAELRAGLKERVTYQDFAKLEKRVVRLEKKVA